ncbi:MAG: flagellar filament capping protein FliD [Treponema sp.]|nr:flagellar filament capping protein FliD [Treponema sp.]
MAGINIPGVTDQYNTNDTVEKLMKVERIPLTREQDSLKTFKAQKDAWRDVNKKMSALRDSVKTLYSYDNPFSNKLTSSTDEHAVTADAGRAASYDSFKIDVIQPATADRFLSSELAADTNVPQGTYTFKVAEKAVTLRWSGGTLSDFSGAVNKRGGDIIKSLVIGASEGKKTLLIESLKTGEANHLTFEDDAKKFAVSSGMISPVKDTTASFGTMQTEFRPVPDENSVSGQEYLPKISNRNITVTSSTVNIPPRSGFLLKIPSNIEPDQHITFTLTKQTADDITEELNKELEVPQLPDAGSASFGGITINNNPSDTLLQNAVPVQHAPLVPVSSDNIISAVLSDGSEKQISTPQVLTDADTKVDIDMSQYNGIQSIAVRNRNTGTAFSMSPVTAYDPKVSSGYTPDNAVSSAGDAVIKYEGITIRRPTNDIDDIVPSVTLHVHAKTDKTATISIKPDTDTSKQALITFVGKYNETIAEINILSQNKPELIDELTYLSDDDRKKETDKLGMFLGDFSLTNVKSGLQSIEGGKYAASNSAKVTMLSQIGISTSATGGYSGYSESKLRGYLEIDEKKLDSALANNLDDIKNMFGYDSDGDLIIDTGIAYRLDKELTAYVQTGGVIASKTNNLDSKIKTSESKIVKLETQMDQKEQELKQKYASMEGSLNSLESQQTTISNFSKQNSGN